MIPLAQRQTCKACQRPDKFDFHVPDKIWATVVPPELVRRVVCLFCFDEFAKQKGVSYAKHIDRLYFAGDSASLTFVIEHASDVA